MLKESLLKRCYADLLRGYSKTSTAAYPSIYVKHFSNADVAEFDIRREELYEEAIKEGLLSKEDKLKELESRGVWSKAKETKIHDERSFLAGLKASKSKSFLIKDLNFYSAEIKKTEEKIVELEAEKKAILGLTADGFSDKKINELYIFSSLYGDPGLKENYFSMDDFDEIEQVMINEIVMAYNKRMGDFESKNLKKIAVSSFFTNFFYLCEDNPFVFFGKPVIDLTFYQMELFGHGRYFKHIISQSGAAIPKDLLGDPDKIIEWYDVTNNAKEAIKNVDMNKEGGFSFVGATAEDYKRLGLDHRLVDTSKMFEGKDKIGMRGMLEHHFGKESVM